MGSRVGASIHHARETVSASRPRRRCTRASSGRSPGTGRHFPPRPYIPDPAGPCVEAEIADMKFLEAAPTALVIPVHGGLRLTVQCLDALRGCDPLPVMVIVVDDGSPDDTAAHLATHYPDVHVVPGDGNLWWGGAINVGCDYAI